MAIRYLSGIDVDSNTLFVDDANNRVGIGTGSPVSSLNINNGDAWINVTDTLRGLQFGYAGPSHGSYRAAVMGGAESYGGTDSGMLTFHTQNGYVVSAIPPERMRITSAGNVGIGTTNPNRNLTVSGNGTLLGLQSSTVGGYSEIEMTANGVSGGYIFKNSAAFTSYAGAGSLNIYNSGSIGFHTASVTNAMFIASGTGNVGIGTTSPGERLELAGSNVMLKINASTDTFAQLGYYENGTLKWNTYNNYANDNYQVGNSGGTYFAITPSGSVGIGTTSPSNKLHVVGSASADAANIRIDSTSEYGGLVINENTTFRTILGYGNTGNIFSNAQTDSTSLRGANYLHLGASSAATITINGGNDYVGIGTTSPSYKLDISTFQSIRVTGASTGYTQGSIIFQSSTTDSPGARGLGVYLFNEGNDATWFYGTGYGAGDTFLINRKSGATYQDSAAAPAESSNFFAITNAGNVGIGTTAPSGNLDISASAGTYMFNLTNADETAFRLRAYNHGTATAPGLAFTYGLYYSAQENTSIKFYRGGSGTGGFMTFTTSDGTERMRIAQDGSVGINTTSPSVRLHVQAPNLGTSAGDQTYAALFQAGNGNSSFLEIKDVRTDAGSDWTGAGKRIQMRIDSTYMGYIQFNGNSNNYGISFGTGGTTTAPGNVNEIMRITTAGNVGIGTTAPSYKLQIAEDAYARIALHQTTTGAIWNWGNDGSNMYAYYTNTAVRALDITNTGNVGIGTTAPGEKLHVVGGIIRIDSNVGGFYQYNTSGVFRSAFYDNGTVTSIYGDGNGSTPAITINDNNVGIGTTSPSQKLHVVGNGLYTGNLDVGHSVSTGDAAINLGTGRTGNGFAYIDLIGDTTYTDYGLRILRNNGGANTTSLIVHRGTGDFSIQNNEAANLVFLTAATERMRITSAGNVGIGTTNPATKLQVDASGHALVVSNDTGNRRIYFGTGTLGEPDIQAALSNGTARELSINAAGGNVGIGVVGPTQKLHVSGNVRVTGAYYDSSNSAGSSGQVLSSTGSGTDWVSLSEITGVDGTGTANYIAKWSDTDTITNSQVFDNGTNVGINNASPKTKLDVNGAIGFGSKTLNISDTFVTVLTVNMSNHTGCYVKITAFGDWSGHSAVAYLGEFFLQNGASAYNEPGVIIRQVDNTNTDDVVAQIVDPAGTGTRDFEIQLKTTSASGVPFSAAIQYEVRGQYNSVS